MQSTDSWLTGFSEINPLRQLDEPPQCAGGSSAPVLGPRVTCVGVPGKSIKYLAMIGPSPTRCSCFLHSRTELHQLVRLWPHLRALQGFWLHASSQVTSSSCRKPANSGARGECVAEEYPRPVVWCRSSPMEGVGQRPGTVSQSREKASGRRDFRRGVESHRPGTGKAPKPGRPPYRASLTTGTSLPSPSNG